jgi:hypothetical protein
MVDFSRDHLCWDNVEASPPTLEVTTRAAPIVVPLPVAKRRAIRGREKSPSGGVYSGYELRWLLPRVTLPADVEPKPADVVVDSTLNRWTVLTVERNKANQTIVLGCVNLVLAYQLRDTITVERATIQSNTAGASVKLFPPPGGRVLYTLAARVQPLSSGAKEERGLRYDGQMYEVTIDRQVQIDTAEDRVNFNDNGITRYLDVVKYEQPSRIDELPTLTCEERR